MDNAIIFNIQKFSVHDGPGIRTTVFFKGCFLNCKWCHNPESIGFHYAMMYDESKCVYCGKCVSVCGKGAVSISGKKLVTDICRCAYCGNCVTYCVNSAREIVGKSYSTDEVFKEVMKDKIFYEQSGGGVTFSGGEPLIQRAFVEELIIKLKNENIHTAIDTSGAVSFETIERVAPYTDLFLYDIKLMDDEKHKKYIGASNVEILNNLKKLSAIHNNINIRMPIVEGVNADWEHIQRVEEFIKGLGIKKISLLPYHDIAKHKYKKLDLTYDADQMAKPSDEKMNSFRDMLVEKGYDVKIGG